MQNLKVRGGYMGQVISRYTMVSWISRIASQSRLPLRTNPEQSESLLRG